MPAAVVLLMGPTAAGKTGLSIALAEQLQRDGPGAEIVSVDSAQIYRGMDIGTAKPDAALRARVPHHLLDLVDPAERYSAARFAADATAAIDGIRARGRVPILVGGTMLYFKALLEGLSAVPPADPAVRARLSAEAAQAGWAALHRRLAQADPATAARIEPRDAQRIQRALEILELTGRPPSAAFREGRGGALAAPTVRIVVSPPQRATLHESIRQRFVAMMDAGFLDEVRALRDRGDLAADLPSMRAVGYRQLRQHLDGAFPLDEAVARGIAATRRYAKRQLTWLRALADVAWLDAFAPDTLARVHALASPRAQRPC